MANRTRKAHITCTGCHQTKPRDAFYQRDDGTLYGGPCRQCRQTTQRATTDAKRAQRGLPPLERRATPNWDGNGRWCSTCGQYKPRTSYHRQAASPDGLTARCKTCTSATAAAAYRQRTGPVAAPRRTWGDDGRHCNFCMAFKPWDAFNKKRTGPNGREAQCRACKAAQRAVLGT
jgi:hypothetical protein